MITKKHTFKSTQRCEALARLAAEAEEARKRAELAADLENGVLFFHPLMSVNLVVFAAKLTLLYVCR